MLSFKLGNLASKPTTIIERTRWDGIRGHDPMALADFVILSSKGWCLVHDTRTGVRGNVGICHDSEPRMLVIFIKIWE